MAEVRQSYLDDYTQQNSNIGIGTSSPSDAKLDIVGGTTTQELNVTGIASFTSASGFIEKHTTYTENVNINAGDSGTLSGEVIVGVGLTMNVGTSVTASQGSLHGLKISTMFKPPSGTTATRPVAKPGSLFYNFDYKTIEFFDGSNWRQVDNVTRRGRGVMGGRVSSPGVRDTIGFITIATRGNEQDFGELTEITQYPANGATSSSTRGLTMGGSGPAYKDVISYITIASKGNAIDFGNLTDARHYGAGMSSSSRAIVAGGYDGSNEVNVIDYVEIASIGNALDFGDTDIKRRNGPGCASPTRGVFGGGLTPSKISDIQFITISSKGNSTKFGDLTVEEQGSSCGSNSIRGLFNGNSPGSASEDIQAITIASEGNAFDFGDMTAAKRYAATPTSSTRAVFAGGYQSPNDINIIDSVEIATTGNAVDFGDMLMKSLGLSTISDSHGGLGGF